MRGVSLSKWFSLCLVVILASACQSSANSSKGTAVSTLSASAATTEPTQGETATQEELVTEAEVDEIATQPLPDPLENLLALRPVKINLSASLPDGTSRSMDVEIDPAGNMVIHVTHPPITSVDLPEEITLTQDNIAYEVYVIDGLVYTPSKDDPDWRNNPVEMDYYVTLSEQMHGFEGFTAWLDMLPAGSLQATDAEAIGGFSTSTYLLNGIVGGQTITGALWYDQTSHALVKAELHVPAVLASNPETPESGEILITLLAENTDVAPVSLPSE